MTAPVLPTPEERQDIRIEDALGWFLANRVHNHRSRKFHRVITEWGQAQGIEEYADAIAAACRLGREDAIRRGLDPDDYEEANYEPWKRAKDGLRSVGLSVPSLDGLTVTDGLALAKSGAVPVTWEMVVDVAMRLELTDEEVDAALECRGYKVQHWDQNATGETYAEL